jgi:hydrogenase maturation protein HypF
VAITVRGVVQGVGFRPFVYRTARERGLAGWVQNEADAVRMEVSGPVAGVADFLGALAAECPPQAHIQSLQVEELSPSVADPAGGSAGFEIRSSQHAGTPSPVIPADMATCAACRAEILDPTQRRYRYPFTNCTNCGPRWSIIHKLPYDRPRTSMAAFAMCAACQAEYDDPGDRRFHAQPVACPQCGPHLRLLDALGQPQADGDEALRAAASAVCSGRVVAVQGIGGFQLVVDATDAAAVARLRSRKHRPDRPFALMFPTLEAVRSCCCVSDDEARELLSPAAPILLLERIHHDPRDCRLSLRESGATFAERKATIERDEYKIAANVAPGNPYLGIMLPFTPLHHLLMDAIARPVVCTSGNLSEEPMAIDIDDALRRLGGVNVAGTLRVPSAPCPPEASSGRHATRERVPGACYQAIADLLLMHNRPIVRPVDDSVARFGADGLQVLRRARGFAPLPIMLDLVAPPLLATGGHLKNTVALAIGGAGPTPVVLSQHIGDLECAASFELLSRTIDDLLDFFAVKPQAVACDLHPDYASTRYAEELAIKFGVPLVRVQHHHAHVAACMAEHRLEGPVLGLSWDGTGYGADGTIWGGEVLLCNRDGYDRTAHLRTFPLPGGDQAARQPRRAALGILYELFGPAAFEHVGAWFSPAEQRALTAMLGHPLGRGVNCPRTSSMGRLFDAVAALCGRWQEISFEGQAAMDLEFAADASIVEAYELPMYPAHSVCRPERHMECAGYIADWEPMVRAILADRRSGASMARISARFHNALARLAVDAAAAAKCERVVLTGGCFQNALLQDRAQKGLRAAGHIVYTHQRIPPGDGGIALGQIFVAAYQLQHYVPGNTR